MADIIINEINVLGLIMYYVLYMHL